MAKHGNRAASSKRWCSGLSGGIGSKYSACPGTMCKTSEKIGICFFFAQKYHTSMEICRTSQKRAGWRTVFNLLGPLTNPGHANLQVLGVYAEHLVEPMAKVLYQLG